MPVIRQQAEAGECQQYNNRQEQVSTSNTTTGRSRSMPAIRQQAEAGECQQYNNRQEQVSTGNTTTGGSRSMPVIQQQAEAGKHQQYNNRQKQVSTSNTTIARNRSATQTAFRTVHTIGTAVHGQYSSIQAFANTLPHTTTQNSDVPGKGEREGEKRAS